MTYFSEWIDDDVRVLLLPLGIPLKDIPPHKRTRDALLLCASSKNNQELTLSKLRSEFDPKFFDSEVYDALASNLYYPIKQIPIELRTHNALQTFVFNSNPERVWKDEIVRRAKAFPPSSFTDEIRKKLINTFDADPSELPSSTPKNIDIE